MEFGGELYVLRLLDARDEERLRSFFHSHTEETIRQRYGLHTLHAQVNRDNYKMLGIFRKFKATMREIPGAEAVAVAITL